MKKKIIAIVITVVIIAGAATGIGITVKQSNDKNTQELVSIAVSEALATAESSTSETTTQSATESTAKESTEPTKTTSAQKKNTKETTTTTTTTEPQARKIEYQDTELPLPPTVTTEFSPAKGEGKRIKSSDGDYWNIARIYSFPPSSFDDRKSHKVYVSEDNEFFYFDENNNRIYQKDWKKE